MVTTTRGSAVSIPRWVGTGLVLQSVVHLGEERNESFAGMIRILDEAVVFRGFEVGPDPPRLQKRHTRRRRGGPGTQFDEAHLDGMALDGLRRAGDPVNQPGRQFSSSGRALSATKRRGARAGQQGSRCEAGAAPATVSGDEGGRATAREAGAPARGKVRPRTIREPGNLLRRDPTAVSGVEPRSGGARRRVSPFRVPSSEAASHDPMGAGVTPGAENIMNGGSKRRQRGAALAQLGFLLSFGASVACIATGCGSDDTGGNGGAGATGGSGGSGGSGGAGGGAA